MTAAELFRRARQRGYYVPNLTHAAFRSWLIQLTREGILEKRGARFYLTTTGRELAGCLAGDLVLRRAA